MRFNKTITICVPPGDAQKIVDFSKAQDMSISAVYRKGALDLIKRATQ